MYVDMGKRERVCVCVCAFVDTCEWYFSFLLTFSFTCGLTKSLENLTKKKHTTTSSAQPACREKKKKLHRCERDDDGKKQTTVK